MRLCVITYTHTVYSIDACLVMRARLIHDPLRQEHGVTAANGTMQSWLASLRCKERPHGGSAGRSCSMEELEAYEDWGREKVSAADCLTSSGFRRLLQVEHNATAPNHCTIAPTRHRTIAQLHRFAIAAPRPRRPSASA